MGVSKVDGFDEKTLRLAELFKAMGHPARMAILQYMIENPSCICNDIVGELPLAQSTISKHLSELKTAGIIKGEISGSKMCYCIDPDILQELATVVTEFIVKNSSCDTSDCC